MSNSLQAPLSIEFSRQEYWSGLPFPTLGYLPNREQIRVSGVFCSGRQILYLCTTLEAQNLYVIVV